MFRVFAPLRQAVKLSTGITGLEVHPNPIPALAETYRSTLSLVQKSLPEASAYRQSVEALAKARLAIVEAAEPTNAIEKVEQEIGQGQIEEVIVAAKSELGLVAKMIEWKAWEPLEVKPAPGQWKYFD
ncbi:hypothetical protein DL93DRAFT_2167384 [Clavulina sp. PMI_390]|nr:hypothetical protein DL93DRAFT_2167384 [Clavulina sp. PMI_390]